MRTLRHPGAGSLVQGAAALCWLPQAALLAWSVQRLGGGEGVQAVWWPALGILLLGLLRAGAEAWGSRRVFVQARAQLSVVRAQVVAALAARSPLDRSRAASGQAASVVAEQAEAVLPYLVRYSPARWRAVIVPLVILPVVGWFSWIAALVLLVAAPLIPLFMAIVGWRAKAASEAQRVEMGGMNAFLLDRLRGLATLRALDAVDATARRLGESAQSLRQRTMAVLRIAFLSSAVLELFSALGVAMVAAYIGFHLLGMIGFGTWGRSLTLGEGLFVLLLAPAFFEPLRDLSSVWHDRAAGEAALDELDRLGCGGVALPGAALSAAVPPTEGRHVTSGPSVVLRGLCFTHVGEAPLFQDFDLQIAPGEHVALLGPSGAGKTALLSLIAGLVPADAGSVEIDGVALNGDTATALRQRMGWMGQQPHVFAGSARANVALGRAGVTAAQADAAMQCAALGHVTQARPDAALGEGGTGLSGGEAVRLALARVYVRTDADLLLVDEPTAHLDTATALRVADALVALGHGRTLIVATHDPVLAARMGRVVRLEPAGNAAPVAVREAA
ncbi:thiol reductant ABC exporter subunit CydD [Variovorax ginsengisoli]|uniref:ATP-binding cassette subfamily C protein CydD n=1 Tax=Variovorax ginsengisoli TaxID=363844 RepID=A0ABT9SAM6_9BURK|nr:thiol reductant ABC exporter subunit CydD [Variovorax ginsengisoli]MDP9901408.1 ATP-binding cassette subfamily C protein CydD [Variovorax ginsengisoli]